MTHDLALILLGYACGIWTYVGLQEIESLAARRAERASRHRHEHETAATVVPPLTPAVGLAPLHRPRGALRHPSR